MFHNITFKGTNTEVITDVFSEIKQARRQQNYIFIILKGKEIVNLKFYTK